MTTKCEDRLPTIDEVISTINHSSLPVVFIEGKDDAIVFRNLERQFSDLYLSIFPLGGRDRVLQLYARRDEITGIGRFCFIADRDTWVYSGVPDEYIDPLLIFTSGYSIENDIYIDGELENLLSSAELSKFSDELKRFLRWYALALSRHLANNDLGIDDHPDKVLACSSFFAEQTCLLEGEIYPQSVFDDLLVKYNLNLRGKSLLALLFRRLSQKSRPVKHTKGGIIELVSRRNGPLISRFSDEVQHILGLPLDALAA